MYACTYALHVSMVCWLCAEVYMQLFTCFVDRVRCVVWDIYLCGYRNDCMWHRAGGNTPRQYMDISHTTKDGRVMVDVEELLTRVMAHQISDEGTPLLGFFTDHWQLCMLCGLLRARLLANIHCTMPITCRL
jgi:hypothetical protein